MNHLLEQPSYYFFFSQFLSHSFSAVSMFVARTAFRAAAPLKQVSEFLSINKPKYQG